MKSFNNLYERIYNFENLLTAYLKARRNKRYKKEVLEFSKNLEENLIIIQNELLHKKYKPSRYREFLVYEPKKRLILALPFKDRVVHQAICSVIEPIFDSTFIHDTYACRKGKGTLAGVKRNAYFLNKAIMNNAKIYYLKMDVSKYFYSIDHGILKLLLRKKLRCKDTLELLDVIIDSTDDPGIPVGNLTSQLFANIYLSSLDHFIKEELGIKYYVRYMDDMIILHHDKRQLWEWFARIKLFLEEKLKLKFNGKTSVSNINGGIDFLGYRQYPANRILRKRVMIKNYRKFKKLKRIDAQNKIIKSLASLKGQCLHCSSKKVLNNIKQIIGEELWERTSLN